MTLIHQKSRLKKPFLIVLIVFLSIFVVSFSIPEKEYRIYQFPKNKIPRIDGEFSDWAQVPESYTIGLDQLMDTRFGNGTNLNPKDFDISVKVGWVKDLNRLYFFLEMKDDYWDFDNPALGQDIFELVVDGNLSGGPFIKQHNGNKDIISLEELHFKGHGAHAQNYHIFTPVQNKEEVMIWGNTPWIKEFPHYNAAYDYNFKHSESGKLKMEFWITPFDHAAVEGFQVSTITKLKENDVIGLSWCFLDFDGEKCESFMNLAHDTKMIYDASYLNIFRLMPLEKQFVKAIDADWSFVEMDRNQRWFQFKDESIGNITKWHWDFGDGNSSNDQHPSHKYDKAGEWTVILTIEGPEGKSVRSKVWDVVTK
ncbi:PKD domain-containing protein [Ulvibacterium marinum]|uniref:PKD domain-containing protein n=1 Tax=Ulvibacterium marinum TaxID=2419782 RepID=A0A3B0C5R7_9FLAO|nr:PKD domain-containing protein [Ulvibacterium marinum]RKN78676.1 PKD domain-containing protein [Ulvibacterium marinum]